MKNVLITLMLMSGLFTMPAGAQNIEETNALKDDLANYLVMVDLTRDVDNLFFEIWQLPVLEKLTKNENRMIMILTNKMKGVQAPIDVDALQSEGTYTNGKLQAIYDRMTAAGRADQSEALMASAELEEHQLLFLEKALERTEDLNAILLFDQMRMISKSNLRMIAAELL
ncbi:MAG: DUF2202 domain-containing protein, partial [Saprospiraceae bacterium]|nr:DUF2202 domain-containing protein [Saprospiraceae bacterium]